MDMMAPRLPWPDSAVTAPPAGAVLPQRSPRALAPGTVLPSHYRLCFGCGSDHPCGLQLRASAQEGLRIIGEYTVTEHHQGAPGLAHGGLLCTVLDEVMGALNWLVQVPAVTGRLEVDFLAPVPVGATLHLSAWLTGQSGRKIYALSQGRLGSVDGPLAVSGAGLFLQVPVEHFARHGNPQVVAAAKTTGPADQSPGWS